MKICNKRRFYGTWRDYFKSLTHNKSVLNFSKWMQNKRHAPNYFRSQASFFVLRRNWNASNEVSDSAFCSHLDQ